MGCIQSLSIALTDPRAQVELTKSLLTKNGTHITLEAVASRTQNPFWEIRGRLVNTTSSDKGRIRISHSAARTYYQLLSEGSPS